LSTELTKKLTLVLGASRNPERASYQAIKLLKQFNIPVIALGKKSYMDDELNIISGMPQEIGAVHSVTLYLGPLNQVEYYDYILSLKPKRIIFNPGTMNPELADLAQEKEIEVVESCMLVMIRTGKY
jgi:uncharacterized protein